MKITKTVEITMPKVGDIVHISCGRCLVDKVDGEKIYVISENIIQNTNYFLAVPTIAWKLKML